MANAGLLNLNLLHSPDQLSEFHFKMRRDDATTFKRIRELTTFSALSLFFGADRDRGLLAPRGARQARDDAHHGILPRTLKVNSLK